MDGSAIDTETLLAIISSLLHPDVHCSKDDLLGALVECDGDASRAAEQLNARVTPPLSRGTKRKREADSPNGIQAWLSTGSSSTPAVEREAQVKPKSVEMPFNARSVDVNESVGSSSSSTSPKKSPMKPVVDLMRVLRQAPSSKDKDNIPRLPPLTLSTLELVSKNIPCTLHYSVLPQELACRLFYAMTDDARSWTRNKWWLFDRLVESPHRTTFFARASDNPDGHDTWQAAAQSWYNGRQVQPPSVFPPVMEEACDIVEKIVNEELRKRKRFPLEWAGSGPSDSIWRANVAASNCYEGSKEAVGYHSDQMTYLGPHPTIASLSLGVPRSFRVREVVPTEEASQRHARTFNIPLPHNSLCIMHASMQERFKHSIPSQSKIDVYRPAFPHPEQPEKEPESSNCRINITFRFYRPDFRPETTPKCRCGVPTVLRADMKGRKESKDGEVTERYFWSCYAGAQNEGKGCGMWKVMDAKAEGRGPFVGDEDQCPGSGTV